MQGQRQGVKSTKPLIEEEEEEKENYEILELRQHDIVITTQNMSRTLYTDQTGKFSQTSSRGKKYQMILHEINPNSTWFEPIKNRTKGKFVISCERDLTRILLCRLNTKDQILDNEAT